MSMVRGGLFGERAVSSARDHCTRTGWPMSRDQRRIRSGVLGAVAAVAARAFDEHETDRFAARPVITASSCCIEWVACDDVHTVSLPSLKSATAQDGPIVACVCTAKS